MFIIDSYEDWIKEVTRRGADKVMLETQADGYPAYEYALLKGNYQTAGHWTGDKGFVYHGKDGKGLMNFRTYKHGFPETKRYFTKRKLQCKRPLQAPPKPSKPISRRKG